MTVVKSFTAMINCLRLKILFFTYAKRCDSGNLKMSNYLQLIYNSICGNRPASIFINTQHTTQQICFHKAQNTRS